MLEIIITKEELYDKCENVEQLYDGFYYPLLVEYKGLKKQLEVLQQENKQLKEIEKEHQRINGELRVENKELKKQLEEADLELQLLDMITDENIKYKNQQKEFIEFLENEININPYDISDYDYEDIINTILSKYKSIIGG